MKLYLLLPGASKTFITIVPENEEQKSFYLEKEQTHLSSPHCDEHGCTILVSGKTQEWSRRGGEPGTHFRFLCGPFPARESFLI